MRAQRCECKAEEAPGTEPQQNTGEELVKFTNQYTKLQDRLFTTIRGHSFYNEGQVIDCQAPLGTFKAKVLLKFEMPFKDIPEPLLQYDTDSPELSAEQIRDEIRSLYRGDAPEDQQDMTIYLLERVKP